MVRQILLQIGGDTSELFAERQADHEAELHGLLLDHPELIPAEEMDFAAPLLVVGRETPVASGRIDLVCVARSGEILLVEFKTGPNNPDFRHTLAQLIDYAAQLWRGTLEQFEESVIRRHRHSSLDESVAQAWPELTDDESAQLKATMAEQLRTGRFVYVAAAQRFTDAMLRSIEYLNATSTSKYYALELVRFDGSIGRAYESRVVARPSRTSSGNGSVSGTIDQAQMLDRIEDPDYRAAIASLLDALPSLGFRVEFVSAGCSLRARTPLRADPISLGWFYPPSEAVGFLGSRDLTLGYDLTYETRFPQAVPALRDYGERAAQLPGAEVLNYRNRLIHFAPKVIDQSLVDAIKQLLAETYAILQEIPS
jgi:hypothetical protein